MSKKNILLEKICCFILPYIILYALYIQINGETSPGGGFQSGVIFASAIIAINISYVKYNKYFSPDLLITLATIGVMIYLTIGFISLIFNDNYLNYYSLHQDHHLAQKLGIFIIEVGVGITVASVMILIYSLFQSKFR